MNGGIFISYRREDSSGYAGRLRDKLVATFPKDAVFMDVDSIDAGLDFTDVIKEQIASCNVLLVLIGQRWLGARLPDGVRRLDDPNDLVRAEIEAALRRGVRVIPVLVDGAQMPRGEDMPPSLQALVRRQSHELSHNRFESDAERLMQVLVRVVKAAGARSWTAGGIQGRSRFRRATAITAAAVVLAFTVAGVIWAGADDIPPRSLLDAVGSRGISRAVTDEAKTVAQPPLNTEKAPGHLIDLEWRFPDLSSQKFQSLSMNFSIDRDLPGDLSIYIAPFGRIDLDSKGVYFIFGGIQNSIYPITSDLRLQIANHTNCASTDSFQRGIFSRWGDQNPEAAASEPPDGVMCASNSENSFVSVRRPLVWGKGHYTVTLVAVKDAPDGSHWLALDITSKETHKSTRIGSLMFPPWSSSLQQTLYTFVELWEPGEISYRGFANKMAFGHIVYNGRLITPEGILARFPDQAPTFADVSAASPDEVSIDFASSHDRTGLVTNGMTGDSAAHCRVYRWETTLKLPCY